MTELKERLRALLHSDSGIRILLLIGFAGMALILLSGLLPDSGKKRTKQMQEQSTFAEEQYRLQLEDRLRNLLAHMEGVGDVTVMITLSSSTQQVFAEEVKASQSDRGTQKESAYVLTRKDGDESALVQETRYPAVQGAVILCSGGGHAAVQERIGKAAAALLGIPASRVYVGKSAES